MSTKIVTTGQIFQKIPTINSLTKETAEDLKKWAFEEIQKIQDEITPFLKDIGYKTDPDLYMGTLQNYHLILGGMHGLTVALYERLYSLEYKAHTETSRTATTDNKAKLTVNDREVYAKGQVADLKGLNTLLEQMIKNIESRLFVWRSKKW